MDAAERRSLEAVAFGRTASDPERRAAQLRLAQAQRPKRSPVAFAAAAAGLAWTIGFGVLTVATLPQTPVVDRSVVVQAEPKRIVMTGVGQRLSGDELLSGGVPVREFYGGSVLAAYDLGTYLDHRLIGLVVDGPQVLAMVLDLADRADRDPIPLAELSEVGFSRPLAGRTFVWHPAEPVDRS